MNSLSRLLPRMCTVAPCASKRAGRRAEGQFLLDSDSNMRPLPAASINNCPTISFALVAVTIVSVFGCDKPNSSRFDSEPLMAQARTEYRAGRNDIAIKLFSEVIKHERQSNEAFYGRALALHGRAFEKNEFEGLNPVGESLADFKNALADFDRAIAIDSNLALCYEYRADTKWVLRQLESAKKDYTRTIELDPKSASSFASRAEIVATLGQLAEALSDISVAVELAPTNTDFRFTKGCLLFENGEAREALLALNSIEEELSNQAEFFQVRSEVLRELEQIDEALADQEAAKSLRSGE